VKNMNNSKDQGDSRLFSLANSKIENKQLAGLSQSKAKSKIIAR